MIKLGIIGAMDVEVATLKEQMEGLQSANIAGMEFCTGKLEDLESRRNSLPPKSRSKPSKNSRRQNSKRCLF